MKRLLFSLVVLIASISALSAQEGLSIPEDVFYLMPEFGRGTIAYVGKPPVQGSFNICALDDTIRFKDRSGEELAAEEDDSIIKVIISGVSFLRSHGHFYRLYPVNEDVSLAVKRDVLVMTDSKMGGYGMESQTTSIQEYATMTSNGRVYRFDNVKALPYRMTETVYLSKDNEVMPLTKGNFHRCFPDMKAEINAWFKENKTAPTDQKELMRLCRQWAK